MILLPTRTDGTWWYELPVELDGVVWRFELAYLEVMAGWALTLRDAAGTAILSGVRLVVDWPLLLARDTGPGGALVCVDTAGTGEPPGLLELGEGRRCELRYYTAEDL